MLDLVRNFEETFKVLDSTVYARRQRHLKDVEKFVLQGAWQGQSYEEMALASNYRYTPSYLRQHIGPKLWKLLSEVYAEKISKTNFSSALSRQVELAKVKQHQELEARDQAIVNRVFGWQEPAIARENEGKQIKLAQNRTFDVLPPVMTQIEARQCIQDIKVLGISLRAKLIDLDLRRGWVALGYSSMTSCLQAEFADIGSKSTLIREWNAGQIELDLQVQICTYPASQLRPLRKLEPQQRQVALSKAQELAKNEKLTAAHVTRAVNEILSSSQVEQPTEASKYQLGDLVRIECAAGASPEQTKWNGCWGIVCSTDNISDVKVLFGNREVDYVADDLDLDDNSDIQFRHTCDRLIQLWQQINLEPVEENLLQFFQCRYSFTDLEVQMIALMEANHSNRGNSKT